MSEGLELAEEAGPSIDRRQNARLRPSTLTYAHLDHENGGIVLDASESGISVHAVVPLTDDVLPQLRLKLPETSGWLEIRARVAWTRDSRKIAGLQFEELPEGARTQIREWLSKEALLAGGAGAYPEAPPEKRGAEDGASVPEIGRSAPLATDLHKTSPRTSTALNGAPQNSKDAFAAVASVPPATAHQGTTPTFLAEAPRRNTSIYFLLVALAAISLTSGWAAGRGKFQPILDKLKTVLGSADAQEPIPNIRDSGPPVAAIRDIEIVDASNQRRVISLVDPSSGSVPVEPKPRESAEKSAPATATAPSDKPGMNFQIWTLASPQRSAASRNSDAIGGNAPPEVGESTGAPDISTVGSSPIEVANPDALPKPQVRTGVLKRGALIHRVDPDYPDIAREQHISGMVTLQATVGADGTVREVRVISGSKLLVQSAVNAVRQWRYAPTLLDGKAIETQVEISLVFSEPTDKY